MKEKEIKKLQVNFFVENLYNKKSKIILDYLNKRGLDQKICEEFLIGYAPSKISDYQLIDFLKANKKTYKM